MKKLLSLSLTALALVSFGAQANDFPNKDKPITLVVPFTAGGPTDRVARDLSEAMRKATGANFVVDNVVGAGGTIGANKVAKAAPDGYTLLLHHIGMATSPALYRKMPFPPLNGRKWWSWQPWSHGPWPRSDFDRSFRTRTRNYSSRPRANRCGCRRNLPRTDRCIRRSATVAGPRSASRSSRTGNDPRSVRNVSRIISASS